MVHLGDVFHQPVVKKPKEAPAGPSKKADPTELPDQLPTEAEYHATADLLTKNNTMPTWIVAGDNEWSDLEDPSKAWTWWQKYDARFDERFKTLWKTERQP